MDEPEARADAFQHEARFYSGVDEFLAATVPFIVEGLERDEPMLVLAPPPKLDALRGELRTDLDRIVLTDIAELGRNPAHLIPMWHDFWQRAGGGARPVRGIGEPIWAGRSADELMEYQRHEALLNIAFAESGAWKLLCPYDVDAVPDDVLADAQRTHPWVSEAMGTRRRNHCCAALATMAEHGAAPLSPAPKEVASVPFGFDAIASVREYCGGMARALGLRGERADDLVLAVHELVSNSVCHGGGHGVVRVWGAGGRVVCEVTDRGHIDLPLAGRQRPEPDRIGRRGLWMANQLCDLVQIRTSAAGNVVRLHQRVD